MKSQKDFIEDDLKDSLQNIVINRLPWLIIGLIGGIIVTLFVSSYEEILASDVRIAFFIPIVVYMSDAVGAQTEIIVIRRLKDQKTDLAKYLYRETLLGICLGIIFGLLMGIFSYYWLNSYELALTVGLAFLINIILAPLLATAIPIILFKNHKDPALGSGPITTIAQDLISLMVFFVIASIIIF